MPGFSNPWKPILPLNPPSGRTKRAIAPSLPMKRLDNAPRSEHHAYMQHDPSEQFAGNTAINDDIQEILAGFPEPSYSRMLKKIREVGAAARKQGTEDADANARHTFREFLVGQLLQRAGCSPEYDKRIASQTPDWFDEQNRLLVEVFTCERGGKSQPQRRVADRIAEKVTKYLKIVRENALVFLVAVHVDFVVPLPADEFEQAIGDDRLFEHHLDLSGLIYFAESRPVELKQADGLTKRKQHYRFPFFPNPYAERKIDLAVNLGGLGLS